MSPELHLTPQGLSWAPSAENQQPFRGAEFWELLPCHQRPKGLLRAVPSEQGGVSNPPVTLTFPAGQAGAPGTRALGTDSKADGEHGAGSCRKLPGTPAQGMRAGVRARGQSHPRATVPLTASGSGRSPQEVRVSHRCRSPAGASEEATTPEDPQTRGDRAGGEASSRRAARLGAALRPPPPPATGGFAPHRCRAGSAQQHGTALSSPSFKAPHAFPGHSSSSLRVPVISHREMEAIPSDPSCDVSVTWVTTAFHLSVTVSVFRSLLPDNPRNIYRTPSRRQTHVITPGRRPPCGYD